MIDYLVETKGLRREMGDPNKTSEEVFSEYAVSRNDAACATDKLLLGALPGEDCRRLQPHLEPVALPLGKVISEPGERISYVFFPTLGIVSMLIVLEDGFSVETAIVYNESVVGISSFLEGAQGIGPRYRRAVTMAGQSYRLQRDLLMKEFERDGELRRQLLRHIQALITQIAQTAVCNRHHRLEMRLCQWLLMRLDRMAGSELRATHKQIANQLGVRREGVTEVASHLQSCGLIHYSRGQTLVLDRAGLEQRVCECYGVIEKEVAGHGGVDLGIGRIRLLGEQRRGGHDLAGLAVAALRNADFSPGQLNGMRVVLGAPALDGGDALADGRGDGGYAGGERAAVQVDGAGATLRDAAGVLGAGKDEVFPEDPELRPSIKTRRHKRNRDEPAPVILFAFNRTILRPKWVPGRDAV